CTPPSEFTGLAPRPFTSHLKTALEACCQRIDYAAERERGRVGDGVRASSASWHQCRRLPGLVNRNVRAMSDEAPGAWSFSQSRVRHSDVDIALPGDATSGSTGQRA